jgi:hypothetical protein
VKGGFVNMLFLTLSLVKIIYLFKSSLGMYELKCVKILGEVVKIRVFM